MILVSSSEQYDLEAIKERRGWTPPNVHPFKSFPAEPNATTWNHASFLGGNYDSQMICTGQPDDGGPIVGLVEVQKANVASSDPENPSVIYLSAGSGGDYNNTGVWLSAEQAQEVVDRIQFMLGTYQKFISNNA